MTASFWIVDTTDVDLVIAKDIYRYRNTATFEPKKLNKDMKAEIELGNGESEDFEFVDFTEPDEVIEVNDENEINTTHSDIFVDAVEGEESE